MTGNKPSRVMFYVQHLLGVGHQARAAAITRAMRRRGLDVVYVTGGFNEVSHDLDGAEVVQLPPARAADATFATLLDADSRPIDAAWEAARREKLLAAFAAAAPDALLIESFPFGRRRFRFELLPLLDAAEGQIPVAASVRDILVAKNDPKRVGAVVDLVNRYFDAVIVHGDPQIATLGETFAGADAIDGRIRYSGYVAPPCAAEGGERDETVVVSVGGGAVGGPLLRAAIAARPLSRLARAPWRLITGPNLPQRDRAALTAPTGVTIDTYLQNFYAILGQTALSISQAGYNTVMDLFTTRTRAVLIPFSQHGETEQSRRAALLAARGHFQVVEECALTPATLAAAIDAALGAPPPDPTGINLDGAARTAEIMADLASGR